MNKRFLKPAGERAAVSFCPGAPGSAVQCGAASAGWTGGFCPYLHQMAKVCAVSFGLNSFDGENNELIPASHILCRIQAVSSMKGELANPLAG